LGFCSVDLLTALHLDIGVHMIMLKEVSEIMPCEGIRNLLH
jgi:hypothetical protein